jgi:hypothetical protein
MQAVNPVTCAGVAGRAYSQFNVAGRTLTAIESLGKIGPDKRDAVPNLIKFYQDWNEKHDIRAAAVDALGEMVDAAVNGTSSNVMVCRVMGAERLIDDTE